MLVQRAAGDLIWSKNTVNGFATSQLLAMFIWQNGSDGFHRAPLPDLIVLAALCCGDCPVADLIEESGNKGIRAALEAGVLERARRHGLRMIGPNCLGILRPEIGLNAAFTRGAALPGSLALVSQSGAICTAMLDWATPNKIGFSSVVSLGGSSDIDFGEVIDYLTADPRTAHILLYIEGIRDARRFMSSVRATARSLLTEAGIPVFRTPEPAVDMFAHLSAFYRNQRSLLQVAAAGVSLEPANLADARRVIDTALTERRTILGQAESKAILRAFRIPVARAESARSAAEAADLATGLGFPVALKIDSPDITHKSDVGGVRLNLQNAAEVIAAYQAMLLDAARARPDARIDGATVEAMVNKVNGRELMVGVLRDPVFGPAISFGMGGIAVEVHRDRCVSLPPLNAQLAGEMIDATRVARMLGEFRRMPAADRGAIIGVLLRVSEMVCELPQIQELDINPLIADELGTIAVDARIVLRAGEPSGKRYAHMAIHPYPAALAREIRLADETRLTVRPMRPDDAKMEFDFVSGLSESSRYFRFMNALRELSPAMLARFTQIDYDREMALVVVHGEAADARQIGVARYIANPDGRSCEFAVVIADAWQRKGLASRLLSLLIEAARERALGQMMGYVMASNRPMLSLCEKLGFSVAADGGDATQMQVTLNL